MSATQEKTIDKSPWGDGLWQHEPDRAEWRDAATGLPCLAIRQPHGGHWCGYVGVAQGHPWHSVDYSGCPQQCGEDYCDHSPGSRLTVHGGLTYADACRGNICHTPAPGEPDNVWWFGFDCAHCGDLSPGYWLLYRSILPGEVYRSLAYVRRQCAALALQLREA